MVIGINVPMYLFEFKYLNNIFANILAEYFNYQKNEDTENNKLNKKISVERLYNSNKFQ